MNYTLNQELAIPSHIAIDFEQSKIKKEVMADTLLKTIKNCFELNIPLLTINLLTTNYQETDVENILEFFKTIKTWEWIDNLQIRVSVMGKWYELPGRVVEEIKNILDKTHAYDMFFLNLCVNYDGQEEIVDSVKIITTQATLGKIDPQKIDKTTIKENIYTSAFLPPELIINFTAQRKKTNFLLWDSTGAIHYNIQTPIEQFTAENLSTIISYWQKEKR